MSPLYLVRHADSVWTPDEMRPLSPLGWQQAEAVADVLAPLGLVAIYSSPWTRARQTVEPLARRLGVAIETVHDLRERQLTDRRVEDFVTAARATWDDFSFAHPGGESNGEAQRRGVAALRAIAKHQPGSPLAIATHGTLLALILRGFDCSLGFPFWQQISTPDIYRLDLATRTFHRIWNVTGHDGRGPRDGS